MSTTAEQQAGQVCPQCGAQQPGETDLCWLCGAEIVAAGIASASSDPVQTAPERFSFSLSTLLLLMTLASVCFGLLAVAPGLGVPMCVLLVPVLVRTAKVVRRREAAGLPVSHAERVSLMLSSFGVATALAIVVAVAAFGTFCGVCLLFLSTTEETWDSDMIFPGLGMLLVGGIAVPVVFKLLKWVRRRYRRDIGEQAEDSTAEDAESAEENDGE